MAKFQTGDLARVKYPPGHLDPYMLNGEIVTITGPMIYASNTHSGRWAWVYPVDLPAYSEDSFTAFQEHHLVPVNDDDGDLARDHSEVLGGWDEVPWQPKELVRVDD